MLVISVNSFGLKTKSTGAFGSPFKISVSNLYGIQEAVFPSKFTGISICDLISKLSERTIVHRNWTDYKIFICARIEPGTYLLQYNIFTTINDQNKTDTLDRPTRRIEKKQGHVSEPTGKGTDNKNTLSDYNQNWICSVE